jgi:hypothetical protein
LGGLPFAVFAKGGLASFTQAKSFPDVSIFNYLIDTTTLRLNERHTRL